MVATFGNLQVGAMRRRQAKARRIVIGNVDRPFGDETVAAVVLRSEDALHD
jgi:hypothetical protein